MGNKILIVEDEYVVANDLRLILEKAGYRINGVAVSVEEAMECLQQQKPDIVLLDIMLEGKKSGIDLARELRAQNIAFVYLSANSSQKILEEAKTTEPYGFLVKPFREKDLLVTLDIAWYRHQYSLESKLREAELLQEQLNRINSETIPIQERLLKIARLLQSHIPFDLMVAERRAIDTQHVEDTGYLRIGFNEYQYIGHQELMTIAGIDKNELSSIIDHVCADREAVIYNGKADEDLHHNPLRKLWLNCFQMVSTLAFPVMLNDGHSLYYFFYSRQPGIFNTNHINLLKRLKISGTNSINKPAVQLPDHSAFNNIIGNHPLLLDALDLTAQVAPYHTSVLILGESGTGKEKIAQSIHTLSPRGNNAFVKVNCAAIPPTLIESELFGHEKGAFTGAVEKRKGKFEQADGGTIFLDEIGELTLEMQVKLLRVLQEKEIEYVGGSSIKKLDVRIIAATNRNLEKEVARGNFRLDLYYRLNVFPITLPSLQERKSDLPALALFFADRFCKEFNKEYMGISSAMMNELSAYNWPGNIRELENVLEHSVILNDGKSPLELKRSLTNVSPGLSGKVNIETLQDVKQVQKETEREYIISVLKKVEGRIRGINGAAELLNIKPTTLESKMAKLGIKSEDFKRLKGNA